MYGANQQDLSAAIGDYGRGHARTATIQIAAPSTPTPANQPAIWRCRRGDINGLSNRIVDNRIAARQPASPEKNRTRPTVSTTVYRRRLAVPSELPRSEYRSMADMAWPLRCQERHDAMIVSEAVTVTPGRTTTPVFSGPEKVREVPASLYSPAGTVSRKWPFRSVSILPTTTLPLARVIVISPTIGLSGGAPPPTRGGPPVKSIRPAIVPVEAVRAIVPDRAGRVFLLAAFDPPPLHPASKASNVTATA
jgi:hypothetical protein